MGSLTSGGKKKRGRTTTGQGRNQTPGGEPKAQVTSGGTAQDANGGKKKPACAIQKRGLRRGKKNEKCEQKTKGGEEEQTGNDRITMGKWPSGEKGIQRMKATESPACVGPSK